MISDTIRLIISESISAAVDDAKRGNLIPVLGAGISRPLGHPLWHELVNMTKTFLSSPLLSLSINKKRVNDLLEEMEYIRSEYTSKNQRWLYETIVRNILYTPYNFTSLHALALALAKNVRIIINLNIDNVVENAFFTIGRPLFVIYDRLISAYLNNVNPENIKYSTVPVLMKFHGTAESPSTWILTSKDVWFKYPNILIPALRRILSWNMNFIFFGYSYEDPFLYFLNNVADEYSITPRIYTTFRIPCKGSSEDEQIKYINSQRRKIYSICPLCRIYALPYCSYNDLSDIIYRIFDTIVPENEREHFLAHTIVLSSTIIRHSSYLQELLNNSTYIVSTVKDIIKRNKFNLANLESSELDMIISIPELFRDYIIYEIIKNKINNFHDFIRASNELILFVNKILNHVNTYTIRSQRERAIYTLKYIIHILHDALTETLNEYKNIVRICDEYYKDKIVPNKKCRDKIKRTLARVASLYVVLFVFIIKVIMFLIRNRLAEGFYIVQPLLAYIRAKWYPFISIEGWSAGVTEPNNIKIKINMYKYSDGIYIALSPILFSNFIRITDNLDMKIEVDNHIKISVPIETLLLMPVSIAELKSYNNSLLKDYKKFNKFMKKLHNNTSEDGCFRPITSNELIKLFEISNWSDSTIGSQIGYGKYAHLEYIECSDLKDRCTKNNRQSYSLMRERLPVCLMQLAWLDKFNIPFCDLLGNMHEIIVDFDGTIYLGGNSWNTPFYKSDRKRWTGTSIENVLLMAPKPSLERLAKRPEIITIRLAYDTQISNSDCKKIYNSLKKLFFNK